MTERPQGQTRMRRLARAILIPGALLMGVCLVLSPAIGTSLVVSRAVERPDVIVSLASHEWERLPHAARLAARYPEALVVLTKPQQVTPYNCHDCANRVARLQRRGVAEERVLVVHLMGRDSGTFGEARAVFVLAQNSGFRRVLVVTSPYHTRRTLATFRHVLAGSGIEVGVDGAREASPAQPSRWLLAGYDRAYVAYEWAALVHYWWKYGVPLD